ncbi:hypothetical protein ACEWY4_013231 [Coilia grayii]|uniref:EGF-like domain-containing protein n=1 Tax=Coilia grayii TaxID=363190 RepID=A0ABD1JVQ7_9TELE
MNFVFWDTIFLLTGSFFSYGQLPQNSTNASTPQPAAATTPTTALPPSSTTSSSTTGSSTTTTTTTTTHHPARKFIAAAVHSHFDDCPDSHSQFCFHGTCRFLILEETAACICHPGFVGMRCEHADLLAVVATNHGQHTVATMLVLCVVGCVMLMLLFTLLNCWWRRGGCDRGCVLPCFLEKPSSVLKARTSCCHSETGNRSLSLSYVQPFGPTLLCFALGKQDCHFCHICHGELNYTCRWGIWVLSFDVELEWEVRCANGLLCSFC